MGMSHGLLRALRSRNPKNTSNPPIFLRKMAPFRCFARHKVTLACASAARMTFCRLSHVMIKVSKSLLTPVIPRCFSRQKGYACLPSRSPHHLLTLVSY